MLRCDVEEHGVVQSILLLKDVFECIGWIEYDRMREKKVAFMIRFHPKLKTSVASALPSPGWVQQNPLHSTSAHCYRHWPQRQDVSDEKFHTSTVPNRQEGCHQQASVRVPRRLKTKRTTAQRQNGASFPSFPSNPKTVAILSCKVQVAFLPVQQSNSRRESTVLHHPGTGALLCELPSFCFLLPKRRESVHHLQSP